MKDIYSGIAGLTVENRGELVCLDLSRPDTPRITTLRLDKAGAENLTLVLLEHADRLKP